MRTTSRQSAVRLRISLWVGLTVVAGATVAVTISLAARSVRPAQQAEGSSVLIRTVQPPVESGLTLRCGAGRLSAPDSLESYTCVIKNNSPEKVRSFSIIFTIVGERDGEELRTSRITAYDMLIHQDFNDLSGDKFIPPGGEYPLTPAGPTTIENAVIKSLEVELDHVEFNNGFTVGGNDGGLDVVTRRREGAAKFRQWLKQSYRERGKSIAAVVALIQQTPDAASGAETGEAGLEQGAEMYRRLLLKRYNTHGDGWLKRVLDN